MCILKWVTMQLKTIFRNIGAFRIETELTEQTSGKELNFRIEIKKSLELFSFRCNLFLRTSELLPKSLPWQIIIL